jgi:hypothetical protein
MLERLLARPGCAIALLTGATLATLFTLPWVRVRSLGAEVGAATGHQLAKGEVTTRMATLSGDAVEPRPWFWAGAGVPAFILLAGAVGAARAVRRRPAGIALVLLSVAGAGVMLLALGVKYGQLTLIDTEPATALLAGLGLYGLTALAGFLEIAVSLAAGEKRSNAGRSKRRKTS